MMKFEEYNGYLTLPRSLKEELEAMTMEFPKRGMRLSRKEHEGCEVYIKLLRDPLALF